MKYFFFFSLVFLACVGSISADSSEDIYSLETACKLPTGTHLGQIIGLQNDRRFTDIITNSDYSIGTFYRTNDNTWYKDNLYFVVNDLGKLGQQEFSELFIVNCSPDSGQTNHFPVHRKEINIQYSPEIHRVTESMIQLEDWQNIDGKLSHVSILFDRKTTKFYHIRNEILLKNTVIKAFVRNNQFYWDIKSFNNGFVSIEVRLSEKKKRNFLIKLNA